MLTKLFLAAAAAPDVSGIVDDGAVVAYAAVGVGIVLTVAVIAIRAARRFIAGDDFVDESYLGNSNDNSASAGTDYGDGHDSHVADYYADNLDD